MAQQIVPRSAERHIRYAVSKLCDRCRTMKIWTKDFEFYDTMSSLEDRSGYCGLCGLLCRAMLDRAARRDEVIKFIRNRSSLTFGHSHWSPILSLCTTSESEIFRSNELQLGFPSLPDPGSETQMKIVSSWIESCEKAQHIPDAGSFIPSRLLYVGDIRSSRVRLLCDLGDQMNPVKYAALSHRWGHPEQKQPRYVTAAVTTFDNLSMIASPEGLDQSELPKTFQDAISVTRKLNLKYLWIDSLCILQRTGQDRDAESSADWEKESRLMEQIFHSAYITIAASCAEHRFDGFLKPRASRQFVTMAADDGSLFHICEVIDNFDAHVEQGELNKRAWVLQERALSRRTIYFTDAQVYWECGQGIRCETFTKMKNRKVSFLGDSNFPYSAEAYKEGRKLQHYQDLYEKFSTLGLTYPSDRPRAISGLETRLMKAMDSAGGYGVFESHFHRGLLWHRELSTPRLERIELKSDDKVPSWSWTAFSGEIRYMNVPLGKFDKNDRIMSPFQVDKPTTSNVSGSEARSREIKVPLRTLTENHQGWLILDDPERELEKPLHCVVVGKNHQQHHGKQAHYVLLVQENREIEAYERVGVAYLSAEGLEPGIDSRVVRIW
ncbi:hypothetical protein V2G26_020086 [Clonostachys chloroleuca]